MTTRMLIDARHREETRVAVVKGNRIEEFDFESAERKQLKGNIYLAKVTRVEPSLQAAFVDYGGNRHGFLAFSEIHPDYYQIPKEDREALLREEAEHAAEEAALRAAEMKCDALFKGTSVDGVYDADPKKVPTAKRYETLSFSRVLADDLKVMDASAVALCRDNDIPIVVFNIRAEGNLAAVLRGEGTSTIVQNNPN